jgi:hypothetical protein
MALCRIVNFPAISASVLAAFWIAFYNMEAMSASGALGQAFGSGWPILLVDLVLCAGDYFGYRFNLNRQK